MVRIIKIGSAGKDRLLLEKGIVFAIRELALQTTMNEKTKDLAAYISLSLIAINETIDGSVGAWEKRGYWLKADRYRLEWSWAGRLGNELKQAIYVDDWQEAVKTIGEVTQKLCGVKISQKNRLGSPWMGSYQKLIKQR